MSTNRLMALRLLPSCWKVPASRASASSTSVSRICSTMVRMRVTACTAWSRPSTDSTPRICASCDTATCRPSFSCGVRKNWSSDFSTSPSATLSSPTTLPIVWRSLTRRYSCSIQVSSGWACWPAITASRRSASACVRAVSSGALGSKSSNAASRYSVVVATSMASSGLTPPGSRTAWSAAFTSAWASTVLAGCSLSNESPIRPN